MSRQPDDKNYRNNLKKGVCGFNKDTRVERGQKMTEGSLLCNLPGGFRNPQGLSMKVHECPDEEQSERPTFKEYMYHGGSWKIFD